MEMELMAPIGGILLLILRLVFAANYPAPDDLQPPLHRCIEHSVLKHARKA